MLIRFGVRSALVLLAASIYTCERCGPHAQHQVMRRGTQQLTVFFIPVSRIGAVRYLDTCTARQGAGAVEDPGEGRRDPRVAPGPQDSPTWIRQDRCQWELSWSIPIARPAPI